MLHLRWIGILIFYQTIHMYDNHPLHLNFQFRDGLKLIENVKRWNEYIYKINLKYSAVELRAQLDFFSFVLKVDITLLFILNIINNCGA